MLAAGVSLKTIQARLGHQDFGTTANTYSHLLEGAQAEAVAKVDELISRVKKTRLKSWLVVWRGVRHKKPKSEKRKNPVKTLGFLHCTRMGSNH